MKYTKSYKILFASLLLFSCNKKENKDEQKTGNNLTALEQKLIGNWSIIKSTDSSINSTGKVTVSDGMIDCESDDVYTFRSDKKYTINDKMKICSSNSDGEYMWSITADSNFDFSHIHNLGDAKSKVLRLDDYLIIRSYYYGGPFAGGNYVINIYKRN